MEILFEILFEFIFGILFEGCVELSSNKNINLIIRIFAFTFITVFCGGIIFLLTILTIKVDSIIAKMFFILGIIICSGGLAKIGIKAYRTNRDN